MGRSEPPEILLNIAIGNPNWHVTGSHQGIPPNYSPQCMEALRAITSERTKV